MALVIILMVWKVKVIMMMNNVEIESDNDDEVPSTKYPTWHWNMSFNWY